MKKKIDEKLAFFLHSSHFGEMKNEVFSIYYRFFVFLICFLVLYLYNASTSNMAG